MLEFGSIYEEEEATIINMAPLDENLKSLYIDTTNYDVHSDIPEGENFKDWFSVDPLIATSISILNKKGYMTAPNSCQGHIPRMIDTVILEDLQPLLGHIAFQDDIIIPSFPTGYYPFPMRFGRGFRNCLVSDLETRISYVGKDGMIHRMDADDIGQLIECQCENLEEWAIGLPEYRNVRKK